MEIKLNTPSVSDLASVVQALKNNASVAAMEATPILSSESVKVTEAKVDLEELLAFLRMETNEARLKSAQDRLASSLEGLESFSQDQQERINLILSVGNDLSAAEERVDAEFENLKAAADVLGNASTSLEGAQGNLEKAKEEALSAKSDYDKAINALEEYSDSGDALDPDVLANLEKTVTAAKQTLDEADAKVASATAAVASAEASVVSAEEAVVSASSLYAAAQAYLADLQEGLDSVVASIEPSTISALREKFALNAGEVDHLHKEIEEDEEKPDLVTNRAVEDLISDSLKRMDEKIIDEIEDRHLDHV